jgi:hypothetical protein
MEEHLEAVVAAVVQRAEEGEMPAAKMVLDRVAPAPGDRRVFFDIRRLDSGKDAIGAASDALAAVADGKITVTEASGILKLLNSFIKISAIQELEARLAAVEAALPHTPNARPQNFVQRLEASERRVLPTEVCLIHMSENTLRLSYGNESQEFERRADETVAEFTERVKGEMREKYPGVEVLEMLEQDLDI